MIWVSESGLHVLQKLLRAACPSPLRFLAIDRLLEFPAPALQPLAERCP